MALRASAGEAAPLIALKYEPRGPRDSREKIEEPPFAAVAAVQALNAGSTVKEVRKDALRARLLERGQILEWKPE